MMMPENGFSSPRLDAAFPAGLRVLVVDDDPTWLKILEKMLKKCSYQVTTCGLAREALSLLRERKHGYDIVISDVNMPDMDGFKLLEHVGLEMDLPVIMMSVDGETSRVMKGVQHGACDYLLKPIRMKELRNIWQHVLRKRLNEVRDIESIDSVEVVRMTRDRADHFDDGHSFSGDELTALRKRKDQESKHDDKDMSDSSAMKKARVVWSVDLHQKFVDAVNQFGFDKVGPKKILELMNVPWLTRENVASHLQKYRLYLDRLQKENGQKKPFSGVKHSSSSSEDPSGDFNQKKLLEIRHIDETNGTIRYSSDNVNVHNSDSGRQEEYMKGSVSVLPTKEPNKALIGSISDPETLMTDVPGPCKRTGVQRNSDDTFPSVESQVSYSSFDSSMPIQYAWSDVKDIQYKQDRKPLIQPENCFNQLHLSGLKPQSQINLPQVALSISSATSTIESEVPGALRNQPLYGPQHLIQVDLAQAAVAGSSAPPSTQREVSDALKIQPPYAEKESSRVSSKQVTSYTSFDPISSAMLDMKNQEFSLNSFPVFEPEECRVICGSDTPVALQDELQLCWLPNDICATGFSPFGLENIEFPCSSDPGTMADLPINFSDALRSDCEYPAESFMMIGQGLFA